MNLYRLTVIALRVWGMGWLLGSPFRLAYIPGLVLELLNIRSGTYFPTKIGIALTMLVVRVLLEAGIGIGLIIWSKSCARYIVQLSASLTGSTGRLENVWPPPPLNLGNASFGRLPFQNDPVTTLRQAAILLLRIIGISWLVSIPIGLTDVPIAVFGLLHNSRAYWIWQFAISLSVAVLLSLVQLGVGLYLFRAPAVLADRITRDLVQDAADDEPASAPPPAERAAGADTAH